MDGSARFDERETGVAKKGFDRERRVLLTVFSLELTASCEGYFHSGRSSRIPLQVTKGGNLKSTRALQAL